MIWTAWNNGAHNQSGAGYGFKINAADRDRYFKPDWKTVIVHLSDDRGDVEVEVNVAKASFWNKTCRELINKQLGRWLLDNQYAPWVAGKPPKFEVESIGDRHFKLTKKR